MLGDFGCNRRCLLNLHLVILPDQIISRLESEPDFTLPGISILAVPVGTIIHQCTPNELPRGPDVFVAPASSSRHRLRGSQRGRTDRKQPGAGIFLAHLSLPVLVLGQTCARAPAARQPAGTGNAQIRRSMSPNSLRLRCSSASSSYTNKNGRITCAEARACGLKTPIKKDHPAYACMTERDRDGQVCE